MTRGGYGESTAAKLVRQTRRGVESLASMPVLTSQWNYTDDQLRQAGVTRGMLRLSVGLEDADDLIADLDQALSEA